MITLVKGLVVIFMVSELNSLNLRSMILNLKIHPFPDSVLLKHVKMLFSRSGSVGGEICKRFSVVFDTKMDKLFLKRIQNLKLF
jgi:hypothetical protein